MQWLVVRGLPDAFRDEHMSASARPVVLFSMRVVTTVEGFKYGIICNIDSMHAEVQCSS